MQIHQHRARGIGDVGEVWTAGEFPENPAVHGAEAQLAGLGPVPRARDLVEDPAQLRPGEIGAQRQSGPVGVAGGAGLPGQSFTQIRGAGVLPDDRVGDGRAGGAIPDHRGLALIGDADRGDIGRARIGRVQRRLDDVFGVAPNGFRVMLDPARLREQLLVLALGESGDAAGTVEDDASARGCPLINGGHEASHLCRLLNLPRAAHHIAAAPLVD